MQVQLAGDSSAVTREEAEAGLAAAHADLEGGRGEGYGVGFGFVKSFGSPRGLDGVRVEFAVTDGVRVANLHAVISGGDASALSMSESLLVCKFSEESSHPSNSMFDGFRSR